MPNPTRKPTTTPNTSQAVAARAELVVQAKQVLPDLRTDGMSDREIQTEVLRTLQPKLELTGKSDAYVCTYYATTIAARRPREDADDYVEPPSARDILQGKAKPRRQASSRVDARAELPANARARDILAGKYRVPSSPRVYRPDWRQPLEASTERVDSHTATREPHPLEAAADIYQSDLSHLSGRDILEGRAPAALYDALRQRVYQPLPHVVPLRVSKLDRRDAAPDAHVVPWRSPLRATRRGI